MTTELTKAAQQALETLKRIDHADSDRDFLSVLESDDLGSAITALERALTQRPAAQTEREAWVPYLVDRADGVKGHYAIGRWNPRGYREVWNLHSHRWAAYSDDVMSLEEADSLLRQITIPTVRASLPAPQQATPAQEVHPLASRCYAMSEPHLSGYRLVLGFETLEAVDAAHTWVANVRKAPQQATQATLEDMKVYDGIAAGYFADAQRATTEPEFDDCPESPTGKHSESWFGNGDCEHCKTGAQNAPMAATPEPLIVKGAMAGMVDAQVRDLWPTKGAALAAAQAKGDQP